MIGAALAASLVWAALAPGGLDVTGDSTCPEPEAVARRLAELAPTDAPAAPDAAAGRVILTYNAQSLRLVLLGPNSNELAVRELASEGTCDDLATAAAVVVAAWKADLDTGLLPGVSLPPRPPPPAPPPTIARPAPVAPPAARPLRLELGLGFVVSDVDGTVAPGAMLIGSFGRGALGLDASLDGTTSRNASVGELPGAASFTRVTLAVGPAWQPRRGALRADLHLEGLLAVLHVRGNGVPNAASDTTLQLGGAAGGRVALVAGTSAVWLGADVRGWPGTQRLLITNDANQGRLARLELLASLGLSVDLFP
jgi:hypothetical protein